MILSGDGLWIMAGIFSMVFVMMGIESIVYERMINESEDMQHTKRQIFKQIKMKYESLCRIGRDVNNTRNFVDKIMMSWKICGLRADSITRFEKVMSMGCAYVGFTFSMYVYFRQGINNQWMIYAGGGLLMWSALKIWDATLDIDYKRKKISIMVTDYLENQMYVAISSTNTVVRREAAAAKENKVPGKQKNADVKQKKTERNEYEEKLIEEVLDEFLM